MPLAALGYEVFCLEVHGPAVTTFDLRHRHLLRKKLLPKSKSLFLKQLDLEDHVAVSRLGVGWPDCILCEGCERAAPDYSTVGKLCVALWSGGPV